jgi:hypothetical protein
MSVLVEVLPGAWSCLEFGLVLPRIWLGSAWNWLGSAGNLAWLCRGFSFEFCPVFALDSHRVRSLQVGGVRFEHRQGTPVRVPRSGYLHCQGTTARVPPSAYHCQGTTVRVPLPGYHLQRTTARVPLSGYHHQRTTARVPLPNWRGTISSRWCRAT